MKKISTKWFKPIGLFVLIPLGLFILWLGLTVIYIRDEQYGLFSLDTRLPSTFISAESSGELLKGKLLYSEFTANRKNLGGIGVRFTTYNRENDDVLEFRMMSPGSDDVSYRTKLYTSDLRNERLYFFYFPRISDSKGKIFRFEIESLRGATGSAVAVSDAYPTVSVRYLFTPQEVFASLTNFRVFLMDKLMTFFTDKEFFVYFIIYSLPFLFYFQFLINSDRYQLASLLALFSVVFEIFILNLRFDMLYFAIVFAWLLPLIHFRISSRVSAIIAIGLLSTVPVLIILGIGSTADKVASWSYIFLFVAVIVGIFEQSKRFVPKIESHHFFSRLFDIPLELKKEQEENWYVIRILEDAGADKSIIEFLIPFRKLMFRLIRRGILLIPYILILWFVVKIIENLKGFYSFYVDFFPQNQTNLFLTRTFIYLVPLYIGGVILLTILDKKIKNISYSLLIVVYLVISIQPKIFDNTTPMKDDVVIWSVKPTRATLWDEITVTGRNFRNLPFQGTVNWAGIPHRILSWSDREVEFQAEPGKSKSGMIQLTDINGKTSGPFYLEYFDFFTRKTVK